MKKKTLIIALSAIVAVATALTVSLGDNGTDNGQLKSQTFSDPIPGVDLEIFDVGAPLQGQHFLAGIIFDSLMRIPIKDTSWCPGYTSQLTQDGCLVYRPLDGRTYIAQSVGWQQFLYLSDALSLFKKAATYSGTTDSSGEYIVTFPDAYPIAPNIQASIIGGTDSQTIRITSVTTTGFTVVVRDRTDNVGFAPTWSNVIGANVDVLITQK